MKKLFLFIGILLSFIANSQTWNKSVTGTKYTYTTYPGTLRSDSGLIIPTYSSLTTPYFKDTVGNLIRYHDSLFFRTSTGWRNIGGSGLLSNAFVQGGNSFGATANLGTNDNYDLNLKANNSTKLVVGRDGTVYSPTYNWSFNTDYSFQLGSNAGFNGLGYLRVPNKGYLNFSTSDANMGSSGFGFRDSAGLVQFKDSLGTWKRFASAGGIDDTAYFKLNYDNKVNGNNEYYGENEYFNSTFFSNGYAAFRGDAGGGFYVNYDDSGIASYRNLHFDKVSLSKDTVAYKSWVKTQIDSSVSNTIYTGDGTLNGDRTIDGDGYDLIFDNVSNFYINGSNLNSLYLNDDGSAEIIGQGIRVIGSNVNQYLKLDTNGSVNIKAYNNNVNITGDSIFINGVQNNIGLKQLRYNSTTGLISYADTASLTGYVPYTGATSDVDLGAFALNSASVKINGTNGNGHIHLRHQASDATSTGQSTTLFANSNGDLKWKNDGNYYTTLQTYKNTADRIYTYQNKSYTLADSTTLADSVSALRTSINTKGSGTVTSIATGLGLSGGTITLNGTLLVDTASTSIISRQRATATYLPLTGGTLTSRLTGTSLILNKDSLPTVTGKKWVLIIDTANSNRISRQVLSTQIDSIVKSFSPTITFTGTTAPSGTETHTYSWQRRGNQVTVICNLKWSVAGSSVSQIVFNLPSDLPTPAIPNGYTNDDVLYTTFANMTNSNNTNLVGSSSGAVSIQYQSSVAKFIVRTSANALRSVQFTITYYTN